MEEMQIENSKPSPESLGFFPPHRRRHLRSETYRTLLRIFSQCYDDPFASQNLDCNFDTENGSNGLWLRTEEQGSQPVEFVGGDSLEPKNSGSEKVTVVNLNSDDNGSQDKRESEEMTIYQIEELMGFEENENLSDQKDVNLGLGPERMIMDELEHIVKGNEDNSCEDNSKPIGTLLLENQSCAEEVGSSNGQRENAEFQQVDVAKLGDASQTLSSLNDIVMDRGVAPRANYADKLSLLKIDPIRQQEVKELNSVSAIGSSCSTIPVIGDIDKEESHAQVMLDNFNFPSDDNAVSDIFGSCNELKVDHEMNVSESELTSICDGNVVDSTNHMTKEIDMEEGEISGGYVMDDISMDMLLQDTEILEKKLTKEPVNELSSERSFFLVDKLDITNSFVGFIGNDGNKTDYTLENVLHEETVGDGACTSDSMPKTLNVEKKDSDGINSLVVPVNIMEGDATVHNKTSREKWEVHPNRKRGPQTKENRANKKKKERKRRAEKNRQLGVRRLKLHTIAKPMSKPKPVNYCRHYVHGRCQEGEKCKFSHDVVPVTKSKPCCHFARHLCMKGDDCPFDHQLSKYPCSNFASTGFCSRGDDCMFSHKILPNEVATTSSSAVDPETKSAALIGKITPQKQQIKSKQTSSALPFSTLLHSRKSTDKSLTETLWKKPELVAKGNSFLSVGVSPLADRLKQHILFPNGDGDAKAGKSGAVQNSNEVRNRTPSGGAPKGINFLSFGRVQRDDLSGSKLASSNGDNGANLSILDNSTVPSPSSDSTLKGIQPLVAPKGINFLSFGRAQQDNLSGSKLASSSSNGENGVKLSLLGNSNMSNQTSYAPPLDSMVKETQFVVAPKGIDFLSFGKASTDDSASKGKAKLLSECDSGTGSCIKSQQNTISLPLPSSTISPVQSLDTSASKIYNESPHLAQRALFSTLAFAAKYECRTKSNQPTQDLATGTEITKEPINNGITGGSQNNLVKASKLLEFLSIIGSKSKQL